MNEPQIQLPALPLSDVNRLLDGLKQLPLGASYDLFNRIFAEAQKQMQAANQPAESATE